MDLSKAFDCFPYNLFTHSFPMQLSIPPENTIKPYSFPMFSGGRGFADEDLQANQLTGFYMKATLVFNELMQRNSVSIHQMHVRF